MLKRVVVLSCLVLFCAPARASTPAAVFAGLAPLTVGLHGGDLLEGDAPIGWIFKAKYENGELKNATTLCSGTLIAPDVVLTANHCIVPFLKSDGSFVLPPSHKLHMVFASEPRQTDPHYEVVAAYHQYPSPGTKGFLGWIGFVKPGGNPPSESLHRMTEHDVALLKLSAPVPDRVRPADVAPYDREKRVTYTAVGYGISDYLRLGNLILDDTSGKRHHLDLSAVAPVSGTIHRGSFAPVAADEDKIRAVDSGDSGGFVGKIADGLYTSIGVISAGLGFARDTQRGALPFHFRAIDPLLVRWIGRGKTALARVTATTLLANGRLTAISAPTTDYATVSLGHFRDLLPNWALDSTRTTAQRFSDHGVTDVTGAQVRKVERALEGVGTIHGIEVSVQGTWAGDRFTVQLFGFTRTGAEADRIHAKVTESLATKGLPQCLLNDSTYWIVASGTQRRLVFTPAAQFDVVSPTGRTSRTAGLTSCAATANLY